MSERLKTAAALVLAALFIAGLNTCKFRFWRAEHPQAKAWTFFMQNR